MLEDIALPQSISSDFVLTLKEFLERHSGTLNYDGKQFYSQLYTFLRDRRREGQIAELYKTCQNPPVLTLIPLNVEVLDDQEVIFGLLLAVLTLLL